MQLTSSLSLYPWNCIAVSGGREQALEIREERSLPWFRAGQPAQGLSPISAQDGPTGEERGPQGRQGPQRGRPEAPLELADQVVQQADEPERRLGPGEAPGAEPVGAEGVLEFLNAALSARPLAVRQTAPGGVVRVVTTAWR